MSRPAKRGRPRKRDRSNNDADETAVSEDYCFECKDGGDLILCDFKGCNKAYHSECVGKDPTVSEAEERWTCGWHSCFICKRSSKYRCHCCTNAVCKPCIKVANFVHVSGNKGFCNNCLKLALLVEENLDVDSDGGKVDFEDRDTFEFLFKDYWEILKVKEGLNLEILRNADILLKKGRNYSDKFLESEEEDKDFGDDMDEKIEDQCTSMKELDYGLFPMKKIRRKSKPKKREFIGWASKSLLEFLLSIGKDTINTLSQYEVQDIIKVYIHENELFHPERKKKVLCDTKLHKLFGRKSVNRNKIYDLLEPHFAENQEQSEDESSYDSKEKDETLKTYKRQRRVCLEGGVIEVQKTPQSCFASITTKNIKMVYLKKSLIEKLLKSPDTFNDKVVGSFVRIKPDPNDYFQRNAYHLGQVTGVKNMFGTDELGKEVNLQILGVKKDVPISRLSDNDFTEEECEDLRKKMKDGLLKKLTVVEVQAKARSLHEDITKHWIEGELELLRNLIDQANEKGWRREYLTLFEYRERRQLLQTPSECIRLLQEVPKVIAEEVEVEASPDFLKDEDSSEDDLMNSMFLTESETLYRLEGKTVSSNCIVKPDAAGDDAVCHLKAGKTESSGLKEIEDSNGDAIINEKNAGQETEGLVISLAATEQEEKEHKPMQDGQGKDQETIIHVLDENDKDGGVAQRGSSAIELINIDDDDEDPVIKVFDEPESRVWHYVDPFGDIQGPFFMSMLKKWQESNYFKDDFQVWKTGQTQEAAILLSDALRQIYPEDENKHNSN